MIAKIGTEVWSAKSTTMKGKAKELKKPRKRRKSSAKRKGPRKVK